MLNLQTQPFSEVLAATPELMANGEWLCLNIETRTAWPTRPQAFTFEGHQVWVMPLTTDNYPGLAANKPPDMDREECFALLHRALSVLAWAVFLEKLVDASATTNVAKLELRA